MYSNLALFRSGRAYAYRLILETIRLQVAWARTATSNNALTHNYYESVMRKLVSNMRVYFFVSHTKEIARHLKTILGENTFRMEL